MHITDTQETTWASISTGVLNKLGPPLTPIIIRPTNITKNTNDIICISTLNRIDQDNSLTADKPWFASLPLQKQTA